jgi:hypothetical protein
MPIGLAPVALANDLNMQPAGDGETARIGQPGS